MLVTGLRWVAAGSSGGTLWFDDAQRPTPRAEIEALEARLRGELRAQQWKTAAARDAGRALWAWLDGAARWLQPVAARLAAGDAWRLEVAGDLGALAHLPWELLHDGRGFLAARTPWFMPVRRVDDGRRELPELAAPKHDLGVLFMAAAPEGQTPLDYEAEETRILDACRSDGDAHLLVEESGTLAGLGRRITELSPRWDVIHVTCHGLDDPQTLALEDDGGALDRVTPQQLRPVLAAATPGLLALSACLTAERTEGMAASFASSVAHAGVPAVMGFASKVPDDAATAFMARLYGHLGRAEPLCEALARTRYEALNVASEKDALAVASTPAVWGASRLFLTHAVTRLAAPDDLREPRALVRRPDPDAFLRAASGRSLKVAPASRFVGRRRALQRLIRSLRPGKQLGAVILGLGGVGKSSLVARALSRVALRPVVLYQQLERAAVLLALRTTYEDEPAVTGLLSGDERQRVVQSKDPSDFRALLRRVLATDALRQKPAVFVLDDAEAQMTAGADGYVLTDEAHATLRGVFGALDATNGCASRVVVTGRYAFALKDEVGRDLLACTEPIDLLRLDPVDARKLLRQADRYDDEGASREVASWGDRELRRRVLDVGGSNARLLALLHRLMVADGTRGRAALTQMEAWLQQECDRVDDPALVDYLDNLVLDELLALAGEEGRGLISFLRGLEVAVPESSVLAATGQGAGTLRRCVDLGLVERDREGLVAVPPVVAARCEPLEAARMKALVRGLLRALPATWLPDAEGRWRGPIERASFLFRWSADVEPAEQVIGKAVAAWHLGWLQWQGDAATLRGETERAERLGLRWEGVAALVWGWATVDGARAKALLDAAREAMPETVDVGVHIAVLRQQAVLAQTTGDGESALQLLAQAETIVPAGDDRTKAILAGERANILEARGRLDEALRIQREEELPVYERLGDVRERAVTMGKIADILQTRGQLDEALRIRREEELPVYEHLGDLRSRAITMGKIADILQARGQLDEALRIWHTELLPVFDRLGDVRSRAVTMGKIADILQARGQLDEALRIRREELLPVFDRLGDVRSRAITMGKIADILQAGGQVDEALRIRREEELPIYERLGDAPERAVTVGKIADILQTRGQLDEALRIWREEELPVYDLLGDVRSRAVTMGKIAGILQTRGQLDEALRIRREEQLPAYDRLGDVRLRAVTMCKIADMEFSLGRLDVARNILECEVLPINQQLGQPDGISFVSWKLGQIFRRQARPAEALLHVERAFGLVLQMNHAQGIILVGKDYLELLQETGAADRIPEVLAVILSVRQRMGPA